MNNIELNIDDGMMYAVEQTLTSANANALIIMIKTGQIRGYTLYTLPITFNDFDCPYLDELRCDLEGYPHLMGQKLTHIIKTVNDNPTAFDFEPTDVQQYIDYLQIFC